MKTSFLNADDARRIDALFNKGQCDLQGVDFYTWMRDLIRRSSTAFDDENDTNAYQSGLDFLSNVHRFLASTDLGKEYSQHFSDDLFQQLEPLWVRMLGENESSPHTQRLYSGEFARYYLGFIDSPSSEKQGSAAFRDAFSRFVTESRSDRLLTFAEKKTLETKFSANALSGLRELQSLPANPSKDHILGLPLLSDDVLAEQLGRLEQKAILDARDFQLFQDAQVQAQMEINRLMRENDEFAHRTIAFKIRDKILNGLSDFGNPITYPSESLFSESLARMDSNGRAVETLLHFRRGIVGPKIEFPRADVDDRIYELGALQARARGISKPHINTTFKSPRLAIMFMERSVDALVKAGYHIDDITVAPHLAQAFEQYKLTKAERFEITESSENDTLNPSNPTDGSGGQLPLPEEVIADKNHQINERVRIVGDALNDPQNPLKFSDLPHEDICEVMNAIAANDNESLTWQEMQSQAGLSRISEKTAILIRDSVDAIFGKFDPTSPTFNPDKVGRRQVELLGKIGAGTLTTVFGVQRMGRSLEYLNYAVSKFQQEDPRQEHPGEDVNVPMPGNTQDAPHESVNEIQPVAMAPIIGEFDASQSPEAPPPGPPIDTYTDMPPPEWIEEIPVLDSMGQEHTQDSPNHVTVEPSTPDAPSISLGEAALRLSQPSPQSISTSIDAHQSKDIQHIAKITEDKPWTDFDKNDIHFAFLLSDDDLYALKMGPDTTPTLRNFAEKCSLIKDLSSPMSDPSEWTQEEQNLLSRYPAEFLSDRVRDALQQQPQAQPQEIIAPQSVEHSSPGPRRR